MNISEINIYPIKSLSGISLNQSIVEKRGLRFDRRWMLVDQQGNFFTQREFPKMAAISLEFNPAGLFVSANGFEDILVPFETKGNETLSVRVWKSVCEAVVSEDLINDWFTEVLGTNCKLVYMPEGSERQVNPLFNKGNEIVSFADGYPLLIIGENSLRNLNDKLEEKISMNRFRPNLVVANSESFAEDCWKKIRVGESVFRVTKPCVRCVVTTIDQQKGVFTGKEPLKTLSKYRMAKDVYPETYLVFDLEKTAVLFGQNLIAENFGGKIMVGDELKVLQ